MLIDESEIISANSDPILAMLAELGGRGPATSVRTGVYEIGHFGSTGFLREYEHYPNLGKYGSYGVCDGAENLLETIPMLETSAREFVVTLTKVQRDESNKGKGGGWRWHKWGEYIGKHEPTTEYLDDEPLIESVYCYHIYERTPAIARALPQGAK